MQRQIDDLARAPARDAPHYAPQCVPFRDAELIPFQDCREPRRLGGGRFVAAEWRRLPDECYMHLRFCTAIWKPWASRKP